MPKHPYIGVITVPRFLAVTDELKARRATAFFRSAASKLARANVLVLRGLAERARNITEGRVRKEFASIKAALEAMDGARNELVERVCPGVPKLGG
jgi:hypothetical protein